MTNTRTLKEVKKLIRRFQIVLVVSMVIGSSAAVSLGWLCRMDSVPGYLRGADGMLAAGPLLTLVAIITFAGAGMIFSGGALIDIPDRWEHGDM